MKRRGPSAYLRTEAECRRKGGNHRSGAQRIPVWDTLKPCVGCERNVCGICNLTTYGREVGVRCGKCRDVLAHSMVEAR